MIPLLLLAACGGAPVDTSIPLNDARFLGSEISATYVRVASLMEQVTGEVDAIGDFPAGINPADVDTDLLRHTLEACFTQSIRHAGTPDPNELPRTATASLGPDHAPLTQRGSVGRVQACNPSRMTTLESYIEILGTDRRNYVTGRVLTIDALRVNLKDVLVAQLDDMDAVLQRSTNEALRLRELSEERRGLAIASASPDDRRRTEVDFELITQELDGITQMLGQIRAELAEWRQLRRTLIDIAAQNISRLGTR